MSDSLGCARCGDCCDPVHLDPTNRDRIDLLREEAEDVFDAAGAPTAGGDAAFILAHWHEFERDERGARYRCDRFDPELRQCTAHDDRPDVCRNFPFYGMPAAVAGGAVFGTNSRCSYLLDVSPASRPAGARPLIPVEVIRG